MSKQASLFDDSDADVSLPTLGVPGSPRTLSKAQKLFNKSIAAIEVQRRLLAQWQAFVPLYEARIATEFEPLTARLREQRTAMVRLLDRAMNTQGALSKRQRAKAKDILLGQLSQLLADAREAELVALYDKYSGGDFDAEQASEKEFLEAFASDVFGADDSGGPGAPGAAAPEPTQRTTKAHAKARAKAQAAAEAREAAGEQAARVASGSVREVYRKLASELHPDRETDPAERARKTALMQRVNQAYAQADLHALLELQLSIEQIDPASLADMAQDRLDHYNRVLQEQLERLRGELNELTAPFQMMFGGRVPRQFTPDLVHRAVDADLRELQTTSSALDADLARFQDLRQLKDSLKHYQVQDAADDLDFAVFEELLATAVRARRR